MTRLLPLFLILTIFNMGCSSKIDCGTSDNYYYPFKNLNSKLSFVYLESNHNTEHIVEFGLIDENRVYRLTINENIKQDSTILEYDPRVKLLEYYSFFSPEEGETHVIRGSIVDDDCEKTSLEYPDRLLAINFSYLYEDYQLYQFDEFTKTSEFEFENESIPTLYYTRLTSIETWSQKSAKIISNRETQGHVELGLNIGLVAFSTKIDNSLYEYELVRIE